MRAFIKNWLNCSDLISEPSQPQVKIGFSINLLWCIFLGWCILLTSYGIAAALEAEADDHSAPQDIDATEITNELVPHYADEVRSQSRHEYVWVEIHSASLPLPRDGASVVSFGGKLYLLGGWNPLLFYGSCTNEVSVSSDGINWYTHKPNTFDQNYNPNECWEGRHSAGWVVHNNRIWTIGGDANQNHYQSDVWSSPDGINWTKHLDAAPWGNRVLHYVVTYRGAIWLMGGQTIPNDNDDNEILYRDIWTSLDGKNWEQLQLEEPFWEARGAICGSVVFKDCIWVIGGGTYETPRHPQRMYYNDVWRSTDGVHWECMCSHAPWSPREYHSVVVFNNKLWVISGYNGNNLNDVWCSDDGVTWIEQGQAPWDPRHAATCFVHRDGLYFMLGNNLDRTIWKLVLNPFSQRD